MIKLEMVDPYAANEAEAKWQKLHASTLFNDAVLDGGGWHGIGYGGGMRTMCECGECGQSELLDVRESGSELIGQCEYCGATNIVDTPGEPKIERVAKNAAERAAHVGIWSGR